MVMVAILVLLGAATAGLLAARDQAPRTSTLEAAVSPTDSPLKAATPWGQRQQPATYTNPLEREISGLGTVDTRLLDAETVRRLPGTGQTVEKNAAYTSGNGALANGAIGGNIAELAQHSWDAGSATRSETDGDDLVPLLPEKAQLKYPNLGYRLNDLVIRVEEGAASAQEAADGGTVQREGSVAVTVYLSGDVASMAGFLDNNGGDLRNVGEDYIEAYVPVTLLGELSKQPGVLRVREITSPQPDGTAAGRSPACDGNRTSGGQAPSR